MKLKPKWIYVTPQMADWIEAESKRLGVSESALIKIAVASVMQQAQEAQPNEVASHG